MTRLRRGAAAARRCGGRRGRGTGRGRAHAFGATTRPGDRRGEHDRQHSKPVHSLHSLNTSHGSVGAPHARDNSIGGKRHAAGAASAVPGRRWSTFFGSWPVLSSSNLRIRGLPLGIVSTVPRQPSARDMTLSGGRGRNHDQITDSSEHSQGRPGRRRSWRVGHARMGAAGAGAGRSRSCRSPTCPRPSRAATADRRQLDVRKIDGPFTPKDQFFTTQHYGHPEVDPAAFRLKVTGLVDKPLSLSLDELEACGARSSSPASSARAIAARCRGCRATGAGPACRCAPCSIRPA